MSDDKPNFALLIGKRLADKEKGSKEPTQDDEESSDGEGEQESMENSAVADLMAALQSKNVPAAKAALKDFIQMCSGESDEPEEEPNPLAE
jgi:hypothetical protein